VRRFLRENGLTVAFSALLLGALVGQALTGVAFYNDSASDARLPTLTLGEYVTSSQFAVDVAENWQSEYLQFLLYVLLTVWLVQKGSPESKPVDKVGRESDEEQKVGRFADDRSPAAARRGDWVTSLYSNSLGLVMGGIFLASWAAQSVAGTVSFNEQRLAQLQAPVSWGGYVTSADFWSRTFQNWQSEFLAVGSMAILAIYLRQRGSPESKPVGASHEATGVEG
jgi:hypothetical protein